MEIREATAGLPLEKPSGNSATRIHEAARQLESQFAKLMISSMREASLGDSLFPGAAAQFRDLYDRELANLLTKGQGLGLQPMIRKQLGGDTESQDSGDFHKAYALSEYRRSLPPVRPPQPPQPPPLPVSPLEVDPNHPKADDVAAIAPRPPVPANQRAERRAPTNTAATSSTGKAADCGPTEVNGNPRPGTPEAFVASIWPHAQKAAEELGVCPKVLVAQAALETGWGRHRPRRADGSVGNNLFGIKAGAGYRGESVKQPTFEFVNGRHVRVNAEFRDYDSPAESFADYVQLLRNSPRYASAVGVSNTRAFARALQNCGYATDPQYAAKLTAIAEGPTLKRALAEVASPEAMVRRA
ncbi:MAG TPA: flagellar assembly peptidoglycan hydrolase FlgJ [Vicinamibacterales bacterium]|nr:flagellar assembly peptidoglycan hydrolase FlgJ [Vicinamibacterales bacterium]